MKITKTEKTIIALIVVSVIALSVLSQGVLSGINEMKSIGLKSVINQIWEGTGNK